MPVAKPENYQAVKECYEINPKATLNEIAKATGVPIRSVRRYVKELKTATVRNNQTVQQRTLDTAQRIANERKAIYTMSPKSDESAREAIIKPFCVNTGRKFYLAAVFFDMHLPSKHELYSRSAKTAIRWANENNPDEIVFGGDMLNLISISKHNKKTPRVIVNENLRRDFNAGNMCLDTVSTMTNKITYLEGNHEFWLESYMDSHIGMNGFLGLRENLRLFDRGIDLIPQNGVYNIGDAPITHGDITDKYHSAAMATKKLGPIFYGHTHDVQTHSMFKRPDMHPVIGQSCGCLCEHNPYFMRNKDNKWVSAFLILYVRDDGTYNYYIPIIVNGKLIFEGKEYKA